MRNQLKTFATAGLFATLALVGGKFEIMGEALWAQQVNGPEPLDETANEVIDLNAGQNFVGNTVQTFVTNKYKYGGQGQGGSAGDFEVKNWSIFVNARSDELENDPGTAQSDLTGLTIGTDVLLSDTSAAGGLVDFGDIESDSPGFNEEADEFSIGGFFVWFDEKYDAQLAARYGSQDIDNIRRTATGGQSFGSLDAAVWDLSGAFNWYLLQPAETLPGVTVLSSLSYLQVDRDAYTERGSPRSLRVDDVTVESLISDIGVEVYKPISTAWGVVTPTGSFSWKHQFEDDPVVLNAVSATGNPLVQPSSATSGPVDENWFSGSAGVALVGARGWSGFLDVEVDLGRDDFERTLFTIGVRKELGDALQ